jgi:hypothetical protein
MIVESFSIPSIHLNCQEMANDIENFVVHVLNEDPRYSHISSEGKELVTETLRERAECMYGVPFTFSRTFDRGFFNQVPMG